jgi:hypothetical protein
MGGITGGNRQLVTRFPIGPSQQAVGTKITDPAQRKVVEEHQKALATQTKIVDEQVAIIQKQGAKPEEIEEAAKKALVQVRKLASSFFLAEIVHGFIDNRDIVTY